MEPLLSDTVLGPGRSVGLLGGSFDPAHDGHRHISLAALRRFGLDHVVWLMSPGNPLKSNAPASLADRMARARDLVAHPRIHVSDFETRAGTRFTAETLARLSRSHSSLRLVWLMGADNLAQFDRWNDWRTIADCMPIGVLARPGHRMRALNAPAARILRPYRLRSAASHCLAYGPAPRWCFVNVAMTRESSSALRAAGGWQGAVASGPLR